MKVRKNEGWKGKMNEGENGMDKRREKKERTKQRINEKNK